MNKRLLAFVIATAAGALVSVSVKAAPNDFYCKLNNGKELRVKDMGGSPQYQYGSLTKTEMSLPTPDAPAHYGQASFSGGGAGVLSFHKRQIQLCGL